MHFVLAFRGPLAFFAVAPEDEDNRYYAREKNGKPSSKRNFGECRGHVETVEGTENEEEGCDEENIPAPNDECDKGN